MKFKGDGLPRVQFIEAHPDTGRLMKEVFSPVGRDNEAEALGRHFLDRAVRRRHRTSLLRSVDRVAHRFFLRCACARFFTVRFDGSAFAFVDRKSVV